MSESADVRVSEAVLLLLPMEWRQVDFTARTLRLEPGTTKNDRGREFPFTDELEAALLEQRAYTEAVQLRKLCISSPQSEGRITPTGEITEFVLPEPVSGPAGITAGPDGNLWFTDDSATGINKIGRITPTGASIEEFPIPTGSVQPRSITVGSDENLWFTDGRQIGRSTLAGNITEFPIPSVEAFPVGITAGPDGNIWFADQGSNQIGRVTLSSATPTSTMTPTVPPEQTPTSTPTATPVQKASGGGCAITPYPGTGRGVALGMLVCGSGLFVVARRGRSRRCSFPAEQSNRM